MVGQGSESRESVIETNPCLSSSLLLLPLLWLFVLPINYFVIKWIRVAKDQEQQKRNKKRRT